MTLYSYFCPSGYVSQPIQNECNEVFIEQSWNITRLISEYTCKINQAQIKFNKNKKSILSLKSSDNPCL